MKDFPNGWGQKPNVESWSNRHPATTTVLLIIVTILLAIALFFMVQGAFALPPGVTTNPASNVIDVSATLNGVLSTLGSSGASDSVPVSIKQQAFTPNCQNINLGGGKYDCYARFPNPTSAGDTLVFFYWISPCCSFNLSDDGGNGWNGANGGISSVLQSKVLSNTTASMTTLYWSISTSATSSASLFDVSPSWPYWTSQAGDGAGVQLPYFHSNLSIGALQYFTPCSGYTAVQGSIIAFLSQSPNQCQYAMQNHVSSQIVLSSGTGIEAGLIMTFKGVSFPATSEGFCWGISPSLSGCANVTVSANAGIGSFSKNIVNLSAQTTYYFRAWASSSNGYVTGSILSFQTTPPIITLSQIWNWFWIVLFVAICITGVWFASEIGRYRRTHGRRNG